MSRLSPTCSRATNPPTSSEPSPNARGCPARPRTRPHNRWKSLLALPIILALAAACAGSDADAAFNGTILRNQNAGIAPHFTLTNQFGQPVSLDAFRDEVVVLTFLYTNCPDVCPVITSQLREVQAILDSDETRFVAVSVDPDRDTAESAREYLQKWELSEEWQFLVGDRPTLESVWKDYYVAPNVTDHDPLESPQASTPAPRPGGALDALSARIAQRYLVVHSTPVFLIDRDGRRRVVFTPPLEPEEVAADIEKLLDAR